MSKTWFLAVLLSIAGECVVLGQQVTTPLDNSARKIQRDRVLLEIPVNSDRRCVGIAVVSAALLEGDILDPDRPVEATKLANEIYQNLVRGKQGAFPTEVLVDGRRLPTHSKAVIDKLSTLVADKYKADYRKQIQTEQGRQKLFDVENDIILSQRELADVLSADRDGIVVFCGIGLRKFADGTEQSTAHAFLMSKRQKAGLVVYDPNDPKEPISCRVQYEKLGVVVEWTCRYRDTGQTTTQKYWIIPKDRYFKAFRR